MKQNKNTKDLDIADHQIVMQMTGNHTQSWPEAVKTDAPFTTHTGTTPSAEHMTQKVQMMQRNFAHNIRNLTYQWDPLSFMNIIITQHMMNTHI